MELGPKTQAALAHYRQLKVIASELEPHMAALVRARKAWDETFQVGGLAEHEAGNAYWRLADDPRTGKYRQLQRDICQAYVSLADVLLLEH